MKNFAELCEFLPEDVCWGDPITPQIVEEIVMADRITRQVEDQDDKCISNEHSYNTRYCDVCGWTISEVEYISARFDFPCPRCRKSTLSKFHIQEKYI